MAVSLSPQNNITTAIMKVFYSFPNHRKKQFFLLHFIVIMSFLPGYKSYAQCGITDVGGKVFMDLPMNGSILGVYGVKASNEPGMSGITVKITDTNGTITNKTTDALGNWYVAAPVFPVKIEFTWKTVYPTFESSISGTNSKTSVQIINSSTCSADFSLHDPTYFSGNNPYIATTCFASGLVTGTAAPDAAIVSIRYNTTGLNAMYSNYNGVQGTGLLPQIDATISQVGSVYGMAYQKSKKRMFFSTFLKRHVDILDGPGYIYVLNYTTNPATYLTKFNLNGIVPSNGTVALAFGTVCRSGACGSPASDYTLKADKTQPTIDLDAYGKVGKMSYGDIDLGPDGKTLFAINLFNRSIVTVDVSGTTLPGTVKEYKIDNIANMPTSTKGILRPFALAFSNGKGYLGVTDDASISKIDADLKCYILEFDPANPEAGFNQKLSFDPNARRTFFPNDTKFHYWLNAYSQPPVVDGGYFLRYSQPILSDIEFDQYGTMYLSIMDRHGHQIGSANYKPQTGSTATRTVQAYGDILKVCNTSTGFVLEGGTGCPSSNEFFSDISGDGAEESVGGSSLLIKGTDQIMTVNFDPHPSGSTGQAYWNTQGMNTYSTITGGLNNWYGVYFDGSAEHFGKANGLGDLEILGNDAPIEIGNRVWKDMNDNGIQDPNEPSLEGVTVKLYNNNDVELASTTTDANGQYIFSSSSISTLLPNTNYKIKITTLGSNSTVTGLTLTNISPAPSEVAGITNTGTTNDNSDAFLVSNIPTILIKTADEGVNNHTFDFGFMCKPIANAGSDKILDCTTTSSIIGVAEIIGNTYSWSPTTNLSSATVANPNANPSVTTTYTLTVTNIAGCTATDAVLVTVDKNTPIAEAGIDKNLNCTSFSTTIGSDAVIPNATYSWSPSTGL
uniref:SdrD B-like domain-containing protein n=1 Tax=Flavobacterium sp. TaxID=239 RepID=UPI0037518D2D